MPASAPPLIVALLTTLSASWAASITLPAPAATTDSPAGHVATIGRLTTPPSGVPVTERLSIPTHSSLPPALLVMTRSCSSGWLAAAAGSVTLTGVVCVAWLAVVASAT